MTELVSEQFVERLRSSIRGEVRTFGEPGYCAPVTGFNLTVEHRPAVVVVPVDVRDVVEVVRAAAEAGVPVAAFGAGHGFHTGIEGVLITTGPLRSVDVDAAAMTARIGAGTKWEEVLAASEPLGLAPLSGADAGVGAIGYLIGGGLGPLGRTFGYGADSVIQFEVVTGLGELVDASAEKEPDLFWGLRGGKTGLGIVVSATVRLVPAVPGENVHGIAHYFAAHDAEKVLRTWIRLVDGAPDGLNAYAHIVRFPDAEELPEPLRGRTLLEIHHVFVGNREDAEHAIEPTLRAATPVFVEHGRLREDTLPPIKVNDGGIYLRDVDDEVINVLLTFAGPGVQAPFAAVSLQRLGGALDRAPNGGSAVAGRGAKYAFHIIADDPELTDTVLPEKIQEFIAGLGPWQHTGTLPNYIGKGNKPGTMASAWEPELLDRLQRVRSAYDPAGIFRDRCSY